MFGVSWRLLICGDVSFAVARCLSISPFFSLFFCLCVLLLLFVVCCLVFGVGFYVDCCLMIAVKCLLYCVVPCFLTNVYCFLFLLSYL